LTPKKAESFAITEECFIEFSPKVQGLENYLGVASDILCRAHKFIRKEKPHTPPKVSVKSDTKSLDLIVNLAESRNRSKEWANGRGDVEGVPQYFIKQAKRISQTYGVKLVVYEGDELLTHGFRLVHAVGRASINKPAFINLSYNGNPDSKEWVAFIGKGVCFDTGGLDIKPGILFLYRSCKYAQHVP
jgi:leucyl aminopeptidase